MNATAHRSMVWASSPPPDPVPPTEPVDPDGPGPKPPPKNVSARPRLTLVSQGPETTPGPLDQPPRSAFLSAMILEFTESVAEMAKTTDLSVVVAGHVAPFVDEICGTGARPGCLDGFDAADLIAMGVQFEQCAAISPDPDLGRTFSDAAHALLIAGATRLT